MTKKSLAFASLAIAAAATLAGCSGSSSTPTASAASDGAALHVGFFGFAAANSFAQGVYDGVKAAAEKNGATSEFVDSNFDGQLQAQQVTDAVTSKKFDVIVIEANDNLAVQKPLEDAIAAGITVVVEFTPVGPSFTTADPQVKGALSIVDPPVANGEALGKMGLMACKQAAASTCKVAYMEGFRTLPLDNARTKAVVDTLTKGGAKVVAQVEGGYTADKGQAAFQDIITANPDVNVVIGSAQAIGGASLAAGADSKVLFVANGGSKQAVAAVKDGKWFAAYTLDVYKNGYTATELGLEKHQGKDVKTTTNESELAPGKGIGTKENLGTFEGTYSD